MPYMDGTYMRNAELRSEKEDAVVVGTTLLYQERMASWIKRIFVFLDNTGNTNKNAFFMGWGMEIVQHGVITAFPVQATLTFN